MALADRRLEAASARAAARSAAACWACCRAAALALAAFCWAAASRAWDAASAFSSCACNQPCTALAQVPKPAQIHPVSSAVCASTTAQTTLTNPQQNQQQNRHTIEHVHLQHGCCRLEGRALVSPRHALAVQLPPRPVPRLQQRRRPRLWQRSHGFFQQKANVGRPLRAVTSCRDIPSGLSFKKHWRREACVWRRCGWQSKYAGLGAGNNDTKMRT